MQYTFRSRIPSVICLILLSVLSIGVAVAAGDAQAGKQKAKMCVNCHGIDGAAKLPHVPNIGGESALYLEKQLKAFRAGDRRDPNMDIIIRDLTDEDIANLVAWYSSIQFTVSMPE
jgi:cytochrome c553